MKKIAKFFLAAIAVSAAASCAKEMIPSNNANQGPADGFVCVTLEAEMDDITKAASLGADLSVKWEVGDSVAVYDTIATAANKFTVSDIQGSKIKMTGTISEGALRYVAVYPYSAAVSYDKKTDAVKVNIPSLQSIPAGKNIDPAALVSVSRAKDGETLKFNNVVSLVKFKIEKSGVQSVCFKGNNDEAINGTTTPSADLKTFTATSTQLTVVPAADGQLAVGDYYATMAPDTLEGGFKVSTMTADYTLTVKTADNMAIFRRNSGLNIGSWTGGTEVPSTITTKEQLVTFAANCDMYPYTATIKLGADINVNGNWTTPKPFYGNFDGQNHKIYNVKATSAGAYYVGIFSVLGDGTHPASVKNLCVGSSDYDFNGKTGNYDGKSEFILESVDPDKKKIYSYGGVVAYVNNSGEVENVVNFAEIEATNNGSAIHVGAGVVGTMNGAVNVKTCTNYGKINDNCTVTLPDSAPMGGVVGETLGNGGKVIDCQNCGEINIASIYTNGNGGVIGRVKGATIIEGCTNDAAINITMQKAAYASYYGGITGYCPGAATFKNCINKGKITVTNDTNACGIGGIVGCTNNNGITIEGCENQGELSVTASVQRTLNYGGIVGSNLRKIILTKCNNRGEMSFIPSSSIKDNMYFGGIIGCTATTNASGLGLSDCHNYGSVLAQPADTVTSLSINLGGLIGYHGAPNSTIENCSNEGEIYRDGCGKRTNLGGLIGYVNATTLNSKITNCNNVGEITSSARDWKNDYSSIGGLIGWSDSKATITYDNCANSGSVSLGTPILGGYYQVGGLVGFLGTLTTLKNCNNSGTVTPCFAVEAGSVIPTNKSLRAGGIAGRNLGLIENCENTGDIYVDSGAQELQIFVGGVDAGLDNGKYTNCSNKGKISIIKCSSINDCSVGSFCGRIRFGSTYSGIKASGEINVEHVSPKLYVGGLCGDNQVNTSADKTLMEGSTVDVKITVPTDLVSRTGLVLGAWRTGATKKTTYGTTENPIKVKGSINGVTATNDNLATLVKGSASMTGELNVINAVLAD